MILAKFDQILTLPILPQTYPFYLSRHNRTVGLFTRLLSFFHGNLHYDELYGEKAKMAGCALDLFVKDL